MSTNGRGSNKPTIVLIHGLWLTPRSWEGWIDRYQKAGYNVLAPSWPGLEGEVEAIRRDPSPLKRLKLKTVVDHYERIIRKLDAPPIIMGHSFGGLITQMLIDRGLGAAGILIDSAQTAGVAVLPFSTIRAGFPILGNPAQSKSFIESGLCQLHPRAASFYRGWQGPHRSAGHQQIERAQVRKENNGHHRLPGVPKPHASHGRPERMGRSCGLRAEVGE